MARWTLALVDVTCGGCGARIAAQSPLLKVAGALVRCQSCGEKYLPLDPQALQDAQELAAERYAIQWEGQPHVSVKPVSLVREAAPMQQQRNTLTALADITVVFDPKKRQANDED